VSNIICLTPVKNEEWILNDFLRATSQWADIIIILDQLSTDRSREIASSYEKVITYSNASQEYNELYRQNLLLSYARKFGPNNLLFSLDADEFLSGDFQSTNEWQIILNGKPGESYAMRWVNVLPGLSTGWTTSHGLFAFHDNGNSHYGSVIHNKRLPVLKENPIMEIEDFNILHMQYVHWDRMLSKHRYYKCLERIKFPKKHPLDINRTYNHIFWNKSKVARLSPNLFENLMHLGIDFDFEHDSYYWYDEKVMDFFDSYGEDYFRRIDIWDFDWSKVATLTNRGGYNTPCSLLDKLIFFTDKHINKYEDHLSSYIKNVIRYKIWK